MNFIMFNNSRSRKGSLPTTFYREVHLSRELALPFLALPAIKMVFIQKRGRKENRISKEGHKYL